MKNLTQTVKNITLFYLQRFHYFIHFASFALFPFDYAPQGPHRTRRLGNPPAQLHTPSPSV